MSQEKFFFRQLTKSQEWGRGQPRDQDNELCSQSRRKSPWIRSCNINCNVYDEIPACSRITLNRAWYYINTDLLQNSSHFNFYTPELIFNIVRKVDPNPRVHCLWVWKVSAKTTINHCVLSLFCQFALLSNEMSTKQFVKGPVFVLSKQPNWGHVSKRTWRSAIAQTPGLKGTQLIQYRSVMGFNFQCCSLISITFEQVGFKPGTRMRLSRRSPYHPPVVRIIGHSL